MKVDDCFLLGAIIKTYGYKGEVILHLDVDDPAEYRNLESMFLERSGKLVPFFMEASQLRGDQLRVKFEEVDDEVTAKNLVGATAYLPLNLLPDLGADQYYYHEVVGYRVILDGQIMGTITEVYDHETNPLFVFVWNGNEILVPFRDEFINQVVKARQEMHINLPEGYLDIYTEV